MIGAGPRFKYASKLTRTLDDLSLKIMTPVGVQTLGHSVVDENLLPQEFGDCCSFLVTGGEWPRKFSEAVGSDQNVLKPAFSFL